MRSTLALLACILGLAAAASSSAANPPSVPPLSPVAPVAAVSGAELPAAKAAEGGHPLSAADVSAWLDGFLPYAMARGDIPGAVVVVVKDGKVLVQKGYGYSDVAARKPVDPETTLFRPGSVSKLFTWTAVMQLVEEKKLDLDADVNRYLDFQIPAMGGPPVTLRSLMTHTPGFDEMIRGLIVTDVKDLLTLEQSVKYRVPPRVTPTGSTPAYSNYGAALAGYIVQRVSGQPFDDYLEARIFKPLGMTHSTFRQPLPAAFVPLMSKGYKPGSDDPQPFEMIGLSPAGAMSASGGDMARFMIAHLQKGAFDGTRILGESTAVEMHDTASKIFPPLKGMLLGFYQADVNGHRAIAHGGDTEWFHSDLNLFIDDGVGIFVSFNSAGKGGTAQPLRVALVTDFADRYLPPAGKGATATATPVAAPAAAVDARTARQHAALLAGRYLFSRRSHTSFVAALNLLSQVKVVAGKDGMVIVDALKDLNEQPKKWREVSPFVWQDASGHERLAAQVENGRVVRFGYDPYPFMLLEPVPGWMSASWLLPLWIASLVMIALTTLAWPVSALVRRHYKVAYGLTGRDATAHHRIRLAALFVLLSMIAVGVTLGLMFSDFKYMAPGIERWVFVLRLVTLIALVIGALTALWNAWVVLRSQRRWPAKLWSLLLAISFLTTLWVGLIFKLAGFGGDV